MTADMEIEINKKEQCAPKATVRLILRENLLKAKVVGRGTALGGWDTQRGINMPRTTSMGVPSLRAEFLLPKGSKMEWKFIKPQNPYHPGSGWTWEPEPFRNRCLQVTTKDSMEVTCTWGELDMEIKVDTKNTDDEGIKEKVNVKDTTTVTEDVKERGKTAGLTEKGFNYLLD
ncbi:uncharacterized protein LOC112041521 [Lingula anatina]|uniref:Uncharacterized protein LOC112041521 n=1 Tax=Lingula anatina TaxID=7574 RepID=A0A2R2MK88_LINAN|nr:uncharacterized protein LOC112041521 [Lingula anatina]|eukprot:XP_023930636.1 uncharacterized protein LOC112041521 [Lingula anatina]